MTDPTRLHEDESNSLDALLLRAGRSYAPPDARLHRVAAGIASAGAAIAGPSVAAASALTGTGLGAKASGTVLLTVLKWLGIGALGGLTLSVTAAVIEDQVHSSRAGAAQRDQREETPLGPVEKEAKPAFSERTELRTELLPGVSQQAPGTGDQRRTIARSAVRAVSPSLTPDKTTTTLEEISASSHETEPNPPATATESSSKSAGEVLREEVAALGLAKAALDRGAAQEALAHVSAYRVRFPRGRMSPEATYLEMEAEVSRGNTRRAQSLAAQLTSVASPNSKRVREVLQGGVR